MCEREAWGTLLALVTTTYIQQMFIILYLSNTPRHSRFSNKAMNKMIDCHYGIWWTQIAYSNDCKLILQTNSQKEKEKILPIKVHYLESKWCCKQNLICIWARCFTELNKLSKFTINVTHDNHSYTSHNGKCCTTTEQRINWYCCCWVVLVIVT